MSKPKSKRVSPNEVYAYLIKKGVPTQHAIGMLANIRHESNFIPDAIGDSGESFGLFQHNQSRGQALKKATNGDLKNWQKQIDFALSESDTKNYLKQSFKTPEQASYWFTTKWERPTNANTKAVERQGWIKEFMSNRGKDWQAPTYNPEGLTEEEIFQANYGVEGEQQPEDVLAQSSTRDAEVEALKKENERLKKQEDEDLAQAAADKEKESKERQELADAQEKKDTQMQFMDALQQKAPEVVQQQLAQRDPELYKQNLPFEVQQANNLFQSSVPTQEVVEAKFGGYFKDGGPVKPAKTKELADYKEFKAFHSTLPKNLQDKNFEDSDYGDPNSYNLYGMWESVGKPKDFNEVKDGDFFPLQSDGTYHGFTVHNETGEFLKPMNHETVGKELYGAKYGNDQYFKENRVIVNANGRYQYVPNTMPINNAGPVTQNFDYDFETTNPNEYTPTFGNGGVTSTEFQTFYESLPQVLQDEENVDNLYSLYVDSGKPSTYGEIQRPNDFDFQRQVLDTTTFEDGGLLNNLLDDNKINEFKNRYGNS